LETSVAEIVAEGTRAVSGGSPDRRGGGSTSYGDGAEGIRTPDPLVAKRIEHKLSYDKR